MDSPQSVVSPFKNLSVAGDTEKQKDGYVQSSGCLSKATEAQSKGVEVCNSIKHSIGVLDVYIHQARDIHNICIYHKQDVYSKLCLTSDPENSVSTQTINGGGRNPVFNESLRLNVRTVDSSLKCEIWMLSRVRNYLEDQLLGFALVPLSDVIIKNGKLEEEFSLSSTDLFHSPAGFVQLSLSYTGSSPEVMVIPKLPTTNGVSLEEPETSEFDKLEFPDPNIVSENQMMVTEYFGITGSSLDSHSTETENQLSSETVVHSVEGFSANTAESAPLSKADSPSSQSSETPIAPPRSPKQDEHVSPLNEKKNDDDCSAENIPDQEKTKKKSDIGDGEKEAPFKPVVTINVEPAEEKVVQQDIVDMYMKSMQQFTESLAKMKLPMEREADQAKSESSLSSDPKVQTPKTPGSRVFYGSRAFF